MLNNKKLLTVLCISAVVLAAVSCGDTGEAGKEDSTAGTETAAHSETEEATVAFDCHDDLPEDLNFNGETFTMLSFDQNSLTWARCILDVENTSADLINDEIYKRNRAVESRLNVTIKEIDQDYGTNYYGQEKARIMSGDDEFQVGLDFAPNTMSLATEGLLIDMNDLKYVDLSKEYWCKSLNDSLSVAGFQYLTAGDFSLCSHDSTSVMLFNKKMPAEYDLESPYTLVKDGKWTLEKFREYGKHAVSDLNGDGVFDDNDRYGFAAVCKQILPCAWIGAGELSVKKDADDIPYLSAGKDEHFTEVFNSIMDICWNGNFWYAVPLNDTTTGKPSGKMFSDGQAFFSWATLFSVEQLRGESVDFGIIPFPKYDDAQETYCSRIASLLISFVPTSVRNPDMAGACLEALCSESYKSLIPTYYDLMLGSKLVRDKESVEMLNIIFENRVCDHGDLTWCPLIRDGIIGPMMETNDRGLEAAIAAKENNINKTITKAVDALKEEK